MNKIWLMMGFAAAFALGAEVMAQEPQKARKPKALLVMLDGLRADALETARTPAIDSLRNGTWAEGYQGTWSRTGLTVPDARPSSAANHTAISTAVNGAKSRVFDNGQTGRGNYKDWPTWLTRVTRASPGTKGLFIYSWGEGNQYPRTENVTFIHNSDANNGANIAKLLSGPDAPDATMYFIDLPDHGGHSCGFYPNSTGYLRTIYRSDTYIANAIAAIKNRPTFKDEDWLILVTADHGGYLRTHGVWGGNATTVPLVMASRKGPAGRIPGVPRHYDLTVTALAHFGIDVTPLKLDGQQITKTVPAAAPRALKDGLAVYLDFQGKTVVNAVKGGPVPKVNGPRAVSGVGEGFLRLAGDKNAAGGVALTGSEKLAFENGTDFTVAVWARLPAAQDGDPVIFSNKDWNRGVNPGIALVAAKKMEGAKAPGVVFNAGCTLPNKARIDIGQFDADPGQWVFFAVTRNAEGACIFYQGRPDGRFNWICDRADGLSLKTNLPFSVGQDGTGNYPRVMDGDLDDFALWTRSLTHEEIKAIYEAGRQGLALGELL